MKILLINGSPKKEKSDTMSITNAFLDGMNEVAKQEVKTIHTIEKHIEYCSGCLACMRNGGNCFHDDDMKEILKDILDSDLLLFSFPLYCYGMPASLKALIDRILPLSSISMQKSGDRYTHVAQANVAKLRFLMICGCGFPNSKQNFEPAVLQFKQMFPRDHTILTIPESPMFNVPEAKPVTEPRLALVKEAGRQYASTGKIEEELLNQISLPMIPEEVYASIVNGTK